MSGESDEAALLKSSRPGFPEGGPPDKPQNRPVRLRKQEQGIHTDPKVCRALFVR